MSRFWFEPIGKHVTAIELARALSKEKVLRTFGPTTTLCSRLELVCESMGSEYHVAVYGRHRFNRHKASFTCHCSFILRNGVWQIRSVNLISEALRIRARARQTERLLAAH